MGCRNVKWPHICLLACYTCEAPLPEYTPSTVYNGDHRSISSDVTHLNNHRRFYATQLHATLDARSCGPHGTSRGSSPYALQNRFPTNRGQPTRMQGAYERCTIKVMPDAKALCFFVHSSATFGTGGLRWAAVTWALVTSVATPYIYFPGSILLHFIYYTLHILLCCFIHIVF